MRSISDMQNRYAKIDNIIEEIDKHKLEPKFTIQFRERLKRKPPKTLSEDELLKIFVRLIAFSQQARSSLVKKIITNKVLDVIFENYSVDKVAKMNPCDIAEKHWDKITPIRQRTKLFQIVMFARQLKKDKTILSLLASPPIPKAIKSKQDIESFWIGFKKLQRCLKEAKTPFLRETTTLLHFLLESGYDCIKPDSAVMNASKQIGIVKQVSGETNFIKTVKVVQNYCVIKEVRPAVIDLYLIIKGRQTEAALLVDKSFYKS